jgi:hypothetical protein
MLEEASFRHVDLNSVLPSMKLQTFVPWSPNTDTLFCSMLIRKPQQFSVRCSPVAVSVCRDICILMENRVCLIMCLPHMLIISRKKSCCVRITVIKLFLLFFLVTGVFFPDRLLWNQRWFPPLRPHGSDSNTFRIMCDIPSIAVFGSESVECFPGWIYNFL